MFSIKGKVWLLLAALLLMATSLLACGTGLGDKEAGQLMYDLLDRKLIGYIPIEVRSMDKVDKTQLEKYSKRVFRKELRDKVNGKVNDVIGELVH